MEALPEDMRITPNPYGFPGELLIGAAIVGLSAVFLFSQRSLQSIRSQLYVERKMFAVELSTQIKERYKLREKCSLVQKECEGVESFKESSFEKESTKAQS